MQIKLMVNEQEKTFGIPFVKARAFRRALEINKKIDFKNLSPEDLDTLIDFVVEVFNNKFTRDDVYDGVAANELTTKIIEVLNGVVGNGQKSKADESGN